MKSLVILSSLLTLSAFAGVQNKFCKGGHHTIKFEKVTKKLPTTLCATKDSVEVLLNGKTIYGTNGKIAIAGESFCVLRGNTNDHELFATESKAILECGNLAEINDRYISFVKQLVADAEDAPESFLPAYSDATPLNVLQRALKIVGADLNDYKSVGAFLGDRRKNGHISNLVQKSTPYNYKREDVVTRFLKDFEIGSFLKDTKGYRKETIGGGYKLYRMRADLFEPIIIPPFKRHIYLNKYRAGQFTQITAADKVYAEKIKEKLDAHKNTLEALIESKIGGLNSYEPLTPRKLSIDAKSVRKINFIGQSLCLITEDKVHCLSREDEDITSTHDIPRPTISNEIFANTSLNITAMGLCTSFQPNETRIYFRRQKAPEGKEQTSQAWAQVRPDEETDTTQTTFKYVAQCLRDGKSGFEDKEITIDLQALFEGQEFLSHEQIFQKFTQTQPTLEYLREKYGQGSDDESIGPESHARANYFQYDIVPGGSRNGVPTTRTIYANDKACTLFPLKVTAVVSSEVKLIDNESENERTMGLGKKIVHQAEAFFHACEDLEEDKLKDFKVVRSMIDSKFPAHNLNGKYRTDYPKFEYDKLFPNMSKRAHVSIAESDPSETIINVKYFDSGNNLPTVPLFFKYSGTKLKEYKGNFGPTDDYSYIFKLVEEPEIVYGLDNIGGYCSINEAQDPNHCCFGYGYDPSNKKCMYNDFSFDAIVADQVENGSEESEAPNIEFLGEHGLACLDSQNPESEACQNSVDSVVLGVAIKLINDYFQDKITLLAEQLMELTKDPSEETNQQMLSVAINMALLEQQKEGILVKLSMLYELVTPESDRDESILEIIAEYTGGINGEGDRDLNDPTGDDNGVDSSEGSSGGDQTVDEVLDNIGDIESELDEESVQNVAIENVNRDQLILSQSTSGSIYNKDELIRFIEATPNLSGDQKTAMAAYLGRVWSGQQEVNSASLYQALDNPNADTNSQLTREEVERLEQDMQSFVNNGNVTLWQRPATDSSGSGDSSTGASSSNDSSNTGSTGSSGGSSTGGSTSTGGSSDSSGSDQTGGTADTEQRLYSMNHVTALKDDMILSEIIENGVYKASFKSENFLKFVYAYPQLSVAKAEKVAKYIKDNFPGEVFDTQKLRTLLGENIPEDVRMSTDEIEAMIETIRGISSKLTTTQPPVSTNEKLADLSRFTRWLDLSSSVVRNQVGSPGTELEFAL